MHKKIARPRAGIDCKLLKTRMRTGAGTLARDWMDGLDRGGADAHKDTFYFLGVFEDLVGLTKST